MRDKATDAHVGRAERPLETWQQIGAFLGKDARTAKRWETERGMPVHRPPGGGAATVFAYPGELTTWLAGASGKRRSDREVVGSVFRGTARPPSTVAGWVAVASLFVAACASVFLLRNHPASRQAEQAGSHGIATADPAARDLYLRARAAWARRTPDSLALATELFGQATARDPRLADAYVGLAESWLLRREFAAVPEAEAWSRADSAVRAALAVDPNLPSALRAQGFIDFWWRRDHAAGLAALKRAAGLAPADAQSRHWYATALDFVGDHEAALREIDASRQLDPANQAILADRGLLLLNAGRTADAAAALREVIAVAPEQADAHLYLANAMSAGGDLATYVGEEQRAAELRGDANRVALFSALARVRAGAGDAALRLEMKRRALTGYRDKSLPTLQAAKFAALAGDELLARRIVRVADVNHDPAINAASHDPVLRRLVPK